MKVHFNFHLFCYYFYYINIYLEKEFAMNYDAGDFKIFVNLKKKFIDLKV
jgi:hypothetical protein